MTNAELIDTFGQWVNSLPDDVDALVAAIKSDGTPEDAKKAIIGGLSYILRKIDIVPDYLAGVGLVDDCMVLRVSAANAAASGLGDLDPEVGAKIEALGESQAAIDAFLGDLAEKMGTFVGSLPTEKVRGRDAEKILGDSDVFEQFLREIGEEMKGFEPQPFGDADKSVRDLKSFLKAKLERL